MSALLDRRRIAGGALVAVGMLVLAATLVLFGPGRIQARATYTGFVFLVIHMTDSGGGQFPSNGQVTVTAAVTNSSASGVGDATPSVTVSYDANTLSFVSNAAGWTCVSTTNNGQLVCTDGTLAAGSGTSVLLTMDVASTALVGDPAFVTGTVSDGAADLNSGSFSGQDTATDSATIANPTSYTKDVPPGSFPSEVGQDQVVASSTVAQTFTFTDSSATIRLVVPAGALSAGTHISIYRADPSFWASSLSSTSGNFVDGYGAAWIASDDTTGSNASSSVTLIVNASNITSTDTLDRATTTGVGPATGTVGNGSWSVAFTEDPGFVLGAPPRSTSTSSSSTSSSTSSASSSPASSSGSSTSSSTSTAAGANVGLPASGSAPRPGSTTLPLAAGVLLIVAGLVVIGSRRRTEPADPEP